MVENRGQARVPALRHASKLADDRRFLVIIMNVEMIGLEYFEIQRFVADLVLTKVLSGKTRRHQADPQQAYDHDQSDATESDLVGHGSSS